MTQIVAVVGSGLLPSLVCDRLGSSYRLLRQLDFRDGAPMGADLALVLHDGWEPSVHADAENLFRATGTPWLRGFVSFGEGLIGPLVRRETAGCSQCADHRKLMAGSDRREMWTIREFMRHGDRGARDVWASQSGLQQLACVIAEEAGRVMTGQPPRTESHLILIHFQTLSISRHFVLPDPLCPVCGNLPEDSATSARISLQSSPKTDAGSYRSRPLAELKKVLKTDYLDYRTGLLNGQMFDMQSPFADASVNLPLIGGDEGAAGRTHRYADSLQTAILEGLERHCGMAPRGRKTVTRGSYLQLKRDALYPPDVGMHAPPQYEKDDFPFQAFDPGKDYEWVWGYSFLQERPVLVPEQLAYYSTDNGGGFVYETSNGCALGGSLEEAVFYGILEVIERDSFLLPWYARLPLPRLDPYSAGDSELNLMLDRLRAAAGYEVLFYNATMEHGIPALWAIAKNKKSRGVNLICAAGAHPDPVRAAKSSVHELAAMLLTQNVKFEENRHLFLEMLVNPDRVRQMEDHSMLYALPEAEERLRFLMDDNRPLLKWDEEYERRSGHPDLTEDLRDLLQALHRAGLDVIVIDQSSQETLRNGLHCVKTLIPGMLPMTFGYHLTRLAGLDRVSNVPHLLGYSDRPLAAGQLNPHPHPFP